MKILAVIFSAVYIGLVAGGASHAEHRGASKDLAASSTQQRELVDVPYTVEYTNLGGGTFQNNDRKSYGRSYQQQQQPQYEIQRSERVYQNTYSQPRQQQQQQSYGRQYVDVPYTTEVRNTGSSRGYSQYQGQSPAAPVQQRSYVQPQPKQHYQTQRTYSAPQQTYRPQSRQYVDVPYTVEVQRAPVVQQRTYSQPIQPQKIYQPTYSQPIQQQRTYSPVQQRTYTPTVQQRYIPPTQQSNHRQAKLIDIPYTVQTTKTGNSASDYRYLPYSAGNSLQIQSPQRSSTQSLVDVPYQVQTIGSKSANNDYRYLPYSLGNSLQVSPIGSSGLSTYGNSFSSSPALSYY